MDVRDFFRPGGGPGRLTARRLRTLLVQLPTSSRYRTKLLGAHPDDRWGTTDHLLADLKDWTQYVFLVGLANATGKKPPDFKAASRPSDAAAAERKRLASAASQARTVRVLEAMRTGDWTGMPVDPTHVTTESG